MYDRPFGRSIFFKALTRSVPLYSTTARVETPAQPQFIAAASTAAVAGDRDRRCTAAAAAFVGQ
jgi:hypothetical protein